jgi:hypothetical protein
MASERELELLDDYISNRLNASERNAFEQRLEADPELKGEFQLQNKIAEGLRAARAAELKSMLGAIPTAGLTGGEGQLSLPAKVGIWVGAAAIVGTGVYFYLTATDSQEQPKKDEIVQEDTTPAETQVTQPETESTETAVSEGTQPAAEESVNKVSPATTPAKTRKKADSAKAEPAEKPPINAFDPSSEESSEAINQADIEKSGKAGASDMPVVNDNTNKKYRFHYQIKDGKLTLYGPFEKNLYELMAFYTDTKVTRFLYHESKYYLLTDDNDKIKSLTPITDPKLTDKLNKSRQKQN